MRRELKDQVSQPCKDQVFQTQEEVCPARALPVCFKTWRRNFASYTCAALCRDGVALHMSWQPF